MILRQVKKISPEMAELLRITGEKMQLLNSIDDATFLCRDLDYDTTNLRRAKEQKGEIEIVKKVGVFTKMEYELTEEFYKFTYQKNRKDKEISEIAFELSQPTETAAYFNENVPCVFFKIGETKKNGKSFYSALYYEEKNMKRQNAVAKQGNILKLALFFYRRRDLYEKMHSLLLENKKELEKITNSFFIEDMITLFSVTRTNEKFVNFDFSKENIGEGFFKSKSKGNDKIFLGGMLFYSGGHFSDSGNLPEYNSEILLDNRKHLIIETNATEIPSEIATKNIFAAQKNEEFQNFTRRINDWAEQMVAMIDFAYAIYDKLKSRILIENI